jgi:hypothetical protein
MDQARNFVQSNRSSIVNIVYIVAAVVLVYYLVMYYLNTSDNTDQVLLKSKKATSDVPKKVYSIVEPTKTYGRLGQEYTVSVWVYINAYSTTNNYQGILALFDNPGPRTTPVNTNDALLTVGLHGKKPQMIVRAGKFKDDSARKAFTKFDYTDAVAAGPTVAGRPEKFAFTGDALPDDASTPCDVMDIDLQRWINVTVSVNGRIMDVYMDGKLARSCILSNLQDIAADKAQKIVLMPTDVLFNGYVSGLTVSNYALTPDVIYGRYQAGPYSGTGFLDYLVDKLGIRVSYTTTEGQTEYNLLRDVFGYVG